MADKDSLRERGKALEDEYFHRKEKELIAKMREKAAADEARRQLGERTGVADEQILRDLHDLGYNTETISLLHLVPLVQMAWAEGSVSQRERDLIIEAARARGIESGTPADQLLSTWLKQRPSEELFTKTLRAIGAMLETRPADERNASRSDLLAYLTSIASASGGVLGWGAVNEQERDVLERVTRELGKAHGAEGVLPTE